MKNNNLKKMKMKLIMTILLCMVCVNIGYSLSMESDQTQNNRDFLFAEKGNYHIQDFVATVNNNFSINGTTYYYDIDYELSSVSQSFYIRLENYVANRTITIMYRGDLTRDDTLYVQPLTLNEVGWYTFKFTPSYTSEPARIYIDFQEPTFVGTIYLVEEKPLGFNNMMGGFINAFLEVVNINLNLWRVLFYSTIFIIVTSLIISLFVGAFWLFKKSRELTTKEQGFNMSNTRRGEE